MTTRAWTTEIDSRRKLRASDSSARLLSCLAVLALAVGCASHNPWTTNTTVQVEQPVIAPRLNPQHGTIAPPPSSITTAAVSPAIQRVAYEYDPPRQEPLPPMVQAPLTLEALTGDKSRFSPIVQEIAGQIKNVPTNDVAEGTSRLVPGPTAANPPVPNSFPPRQMELALATPPLPAAAVRSANGLVSISVRDTPLHALLAAVAEQQGLSIVVPSSLDINVTVTLQPTQLENALDAIMAISNCSWSRTNDVIYVTTVDKEDPQNFMTQGRVMKVFNLNHISAKDVETVVTGLLSPVGKAFSREATSDNKLKAAEQVVVEDLPAYVARVGDYIAQADQAPLQAIVEVRILQVRLANENAHGIQLEQLARGAGPEVWLKTQTFSDDTNPGAVFTIGGSHFNKVMDLLARTTDSKTLASPRLLMVNGQESRIQIGSRLAFSTSTTTQTATVQAVEFLDVGTVLTVTPQIGDNGFILMKINPKVSTGVIDPVSKLPNEDTTELNTTILIPDGHGVIIGGLIQESDIERQTKVPVLGDLWLIGRLFQRRTVNRERTEVVVALLPRIVNCDLTPTNLDYENLGRIDLPLLTPELQSAPRPEPSLPDAIRKPIWPQRTLSR